MSLFDMAKFQGKTIEEATNLGVKELSEKYPSTTIDDYEVTILQNPVNKLFIKKEAIIEIKLKNESADRIMREEAEKAKLAEEERQRKIAEEERLKKEKEKQAQKEFEKKLAAFREELITLDTNFIALMDTLCRSLYLDACILVEAQLNFDLDNTANDLLHVWELFFDFKSLDDISKEKLLSIFEELLSKYEDNIVRDENTTTGGFYNYKYYLENNYKLFRNRSSEIYIHKIMGIVDDIDANIDSDLKVGKTMSQCSPHDTFYEWNKSESAERYKDARYRLYTKYFRNLYCIPVFMLDYKNAQIILKNTELMTIIQNATDGSIMGSPNEDLYEIYEQYYSDIFETKLDEYDFRNAYNVATLAASFDDSYQTGKELLESINIDNNEIIDEFLSKDKDNRGFFFNYLITEKLEKGTLDDIIDNDKYDALVYSIINISIVNLLKKIDLIDFIPELYHAREFREKIELYAKKYKLLHPNHEVTDGVKNIKEQLEQAQTGVDFENVLALIYRQMGYEVETTKTSGDQGADLIIQKNGIKAVIQAKYYSSSVGNSAVQEVVAAMKYYNASKGIVITNSEFTNSAKELAVVNEIQLIDGKGLESLINSLI